MLVDTHCHLDFPHFDADREVTLERARGAGIEFIVNPGSDMESSRRAVSLAGNYPDVYAAVGIHPHNALSLDAAALTELRALAQSPKVVAIGEIGLDYYRDLSPRAAQEEAFRLQLDLAAELDKPVIIHDRDAHADVARILEEWSNARGSKGGWPAGVLHAFSGDRELAEAGFRWGFMVAIGGPLTFQNARRLQGLARELPLIHLVVETDAPYLSPHPYRGQRNEPARVTLVAETLAALHGLPLAEIARQTTTNARRLFRIK
ncbi:MAG: TatD family hydrolase [Anaerolineae bacterium]|nr:TatD family hydrolase [Anaerolineae bacterium]